MDRWVSREFETEYVSRGYWSTVETTPLLLERNAIEQPNKIAVVDDGGRRFTYSELDSLSSALATGLLNRGIVPGDVVGVQLPNRVEGSLVSCALERLGVIVCPLVPAYRENELSFIVRTTEMKAIFVVGNYRGYDHVGLAQRVAMSEPSLKLIVTLDGSSGGEGVVTIDGLVSDGDGARFSSGPTDPNAVSAILFTSGTEAAPKGILHTQNTLLSNLRSLTRLLGMGEQDGVFMASPIGHGTGFAFGLKLAIYLGSTLTLLDKWDPLRAAELLSSERSVYTHGATPFVRDLLNVSDVSKRFDLSRLRYFVTGGAAIAPGTCGEIRDTLGCELLRLYGQTEGFMCSINRPFDTDEHLENTDGLPAPGVEFRVVDDDDRPVADGEVGHCLYTGPHRCVGVLADEDRIAKMMTKDGWLRSGDLIALDGDGYLTVRGRTKEVINRGGYKYSPREVEDVLEKHPAIHAIAVASSADDRLVERACAFVVLAPGASITLTELQDLLRSHGVAQFKWPEDLRIIDALPMTPSGKVQRFVLADLLASENIGAS
jgi:non-ribosomal peptide synthetase component E (peptide arylation enzyme)